jgi:ribonuclease HI
MAKSKKYYVVWTGAKPGIYTQWSEAEKQIKGYPGARFKSYPSAAEANQAFASGAPRTTTSLKGTSPTAKTPRKQVGRPIPGSLCVDAACSGNPGLMEYRGVWLDSGEQWFHQGPFHEGTNNIGEFLALVHALAALDKAGRHDIPIYSDSKISMGWVQKGKCNTKLDHSPRNKEIFDMIARAESWLKTHRIQNRILKWETDVWGEIPADFGRK